MELSHFDEEGRTIMVDVTAKADTEREAVAEGLIYFNEAVAAAIAGGKSPKGDVIGAATIAGIMAVKRAWELIPACHNIPIGSCRIVFEDGGLQSGNGEPGSGDLQYGKDASAPARANALLCRCTVKTTGKTGAEMEALTGTSVALLTVYDMCKALDKAMVIDNIRLRRKTGGKSGEIINI